MEIYTPKDGKKYMFLSSDKASSDSAVAWNGAAWDIYFTRALLLSDREEFVGTFEDMDDAKAAVRELFAKSIEAKKAIEASREA